jgi:hypothetical protein
MKQSDLANAVAHAPACAELGLYIVALLLALVALALLAIGMVVVAHDFIVSAKNRWRQP